MRVINTTVEDFYELLCKLIEPKNQSDKTTFMRISRWVVGKCADGTFNEYEMVPGILKVNDCNAEYGLLD